ncbi:MAG: porin family protein, partial [Tunicatimonas sp.]
MKRLVGLLMLALVTSSAFAQLNYGIKGGASLTGMALEYLGISNAQYRLSYQAGVYGVQSVSERVFFRPELMYANKGFRAETPSVTVGNPDESFTMRLHYLSMPLLAGYSLSKRLFVLLGPEISYLFAARSRFGSESN